MDYRSQSLASLASDPVDKEDFLLAIRYLTNKIKMQPNISEHYFDRSICNYKIGEYQASLDDANAAIKLNSSYYAIHFQRGLAMIALSRRNDAVSAFKKAIELRAREEDSKLSDIWRVLRDCIEIYMIHRPGMTNPADESSSATHMLQETSPRSEVSQDQANEPTGSAEINIVQNMNENKSANHASVGIGSSNIDTNCNNRNNNNHNDNDISNTNSESKQIINNHNHHQIVNHNNTPSSSVAIVLNQQHNQTPTTTVSTSSKEDSYSSKYKRLRRDRERARRGTSKLCTIRPNDLEELQKASQSDDPSKRYMRVIAPIDGWLYSGQLSIDDSSCNGGDSQPKYVVKLDGDLSCSTYEFSLISVLNDVMKEVRVNSVSELRKGARICCYWSRQYKCLSTGVVTSRTFEATKSLVSVKYDNGDLSAVPLEDLRLLPPDYPKYMSSCDPLLMSRNVDATHVNATLSATSDVPTNQSQSQQQQPQPTQDQQVQRQQNGTRNLVSESDSIHHSATPQSKTQPSFTSNSDTKSLNRHSSNDETTRHNEADLNSDFNDDMSDRPLVIDDGRCEREISEATRADGNGSHNGMILFSDDDETDDEVVKIEVVESGDEDSDQTIPETHDALELITRDDNDIMLEGRQDYRHTETSELAERVSRLRDQISTTNELALNSMQPSPEELFGVEYRPWVFEGPAKRNKRQGRIYRDYYSSIRRGNEVLKIGDSAELMPRDESILPFIAKIDGLWATSRGEMRVRVRWYYRLVETEGEPYELTDGENALFETDHIDENDVQSIYRATNIMSWSEYQKNHLGHTNASNDAKPKIFYLAGYYNPVRRNKILKTDVKEAL